MRGGGPHQQADLDRRGPDRIGEVSAGSELDFKSLYLKVKIFAVESSLVWTCTSLWL